MKACLRRVVRFLSLFFCGDPYPQTPATIARAKEVQADDRQRYRVDCDGHPLRYTGLSAVMDASRETAHVVYFGEARRRLLAKSLIEECGQLTGAAFTFERKEK